VSLVSTAKAAARQSKELEMDNAKLARTIKALFDGSITTDDLAEMDELVQCRTRTIVHEGDERAEGFVLRLADGTEFEVLVSKR
jgi:hypothetical protein